ncbi:MAG: NYN domain-containing protein [Bacteroidota bacterium]|nr:NYN domain-containing protein [Bacteroidota bacterium]
MPHLRPHTTSESGMDYAAILIDFENIYYYLKNEYADIPELTEFSLDMFRTLGDYLETEMDLLPIVRFAYGDFERLAAPLGSMYLMGIEIRNVLGAQHKNAADMRLCIDAMQILYTRPDIRTFVFVAGDRDYIPVIQHIQTQARTVKVVAFEGNLSGDLLQNIGRKHFIDAAMLLGTERMEKLQREAAYAREAERLREEARQRILAEKAKEAAARSEKSEAEVTPSGTLQSPEHGKLAATASTRAQESRKEEPVTFESTMPIEDESSRVCLEFMLRDYGSFSEIYLIPFLRKFNDVLPTLADHERKAILGTLEQYGAIRVLVRRGEPNDYRVIIVNYNHPTVRELNPG